MANRFAHRPRYRTTRNAAQSSQYASQDFYSCRWTYRHLRFSYPKIPLGQSLALVPIYRFIHTG